MNEKDEFEGKSLLNVLAAVVFVGGMFLMLLAGSVDMAKIPEWFLIAVWFFVVLMVTFSIAGAARTQEKFARIEKYLSFDREHADAAAGKSEQGDEASRKYIACNSNKVPAVLVVFVALLCAYNIYLSRKIYLMSENAEIDHLRVQRIELVQPSGQVSGTLYAGNDGDSPEIELVEEDKGNSFRMGFAGGTGPILEMITDWNTGDGPDTRILLGSLYNGPDVSGLMIEGRNATEWPPITLGWITQRATTKPNRYVYSIPGDPFMDIETIK